MIPWEPVRPHSLGVSGGNSAAVRDRILLSGTAVAGDIAPMPDSDDLEVSPVCKLCRQAIDWRNLRIEDREIQPRVWERMYWCPMCGAVLEFSSWQTGISKGR